MIVHPVRLTMLGLAMSLLVIAVTAAFVIETAVAAVITFLVIATVICVAARFDDHHRTRTPFWEQDHRARQVDDVVEHDEVSPW